MQEEDSAELEETLLLLLFADELLFEEELLFADELL